MPKSSLDMNVFDAAVERLRELYRGGHTIVVSFSGGKDSGVCVELAIIAATMEDKLPVHVIMRDEEIMFPGTFEYAERVAKRDEVDFHWIYANQPIVNIFNRECPYYWVFDPLLDPSEWVRQPPDFAYKIDDLSIQRMVTEDRFPVKPGKKLITVTGVTAAESPARRMSVYSTGGYLTKNKVGEAYIAKPIYDWDPGDIWKAISDNKWDYNSAYDVMARHGISRRNLRIAPPLMLPTGISHFQVAARAFPTWFNKVCERLPGARLGAHFGIKAIEPIRRLGETWEECFHRTCIEEAPAWIAERSIKVRDFVLARHARHSNTPLSQKNACNRCWMVGSWERLAKVMYTGDPFLSRLTAAFMSVVGYVEPEYFRPGAGQWNGSPTF